jgi:TatD DNase family protein
MSFRPTMIDAHAHLTDERFRDDVEEVIARAEAEGVEVVVSIATDVADARAALRLAETHSGIYATAGIHPHAAAGATAEDLDAVAELLRHPRVVAVGEAGLDYHYDFAPRERQLEVFRSQLRLGMETDLPVVVHAREADDDVEALIREAGPGCRGVLHCFSSGRPLLEAALELGWYVSFAGMITFKRYDAADLLRAVPLDRLLVETDSPYLAPVPFRGKRNEPAHVVQVAARAAELRGEDPAVVAQATAANARAFYRLPHAPAA